MPLLPAYGRLLLTDFGNYPAWNPFIQKITGKPAKNTRLGVHMPDPQDSTIVLTPAVLVAEKDIDLRCLANWKKGNSVLIIDFLLSLW
jgi:hypothetical protein